MRTGPGRPAASRRTLSSRGGSGRCEFAALAAGSGVTLSLGRAGQCWDNALSESFLASLKGELFDLQAWPPPASVLYTKTSPTDKRQ
jgi:transposase InsO family protein